MDKYEVEKEVGYRTRETYYHKKGNDNYKIIATEEDKNKFDVFLKISNTWVLMGFGNRKDWQSVIDANEGKKINENIDRR